MARNIAFKIIIPTIIYSGILLYLIYLFSTLRTDVLLNSQENYKPLTDVSFQGSTQTEILDMELANQRVKIHFGDDYSYPFGGMEYPLSSPISLKSYDRIKIHFTLEGIKTLSLCLLVSTPNYPENLGWFEAEVPSMDRETEYTLALRDFYAPTWWFYHNEIPITLYRLGKDFSQVQSLEIRCRKRFPQDEEALLWVESLQFYRSVMNIAVRLGMVLLFFSLSTFMVFPPKWFLRILNSETRKISLPYKAITIKRNERWENVLLPVLKEEFVHPKISKSYVSRQTMLSELEITRLVKENTGKSFPQYINDLRLKKARRLLIATNDPIINIALDSGFGSLTQFNSTFKKKYQSTPGQYRKVNNENQ